MQPESIEREMRDIFDYGMLRAPAVIVLDDLDVLTPKAAEQSQDAEYSNRYDMHIGIIGNPPVL